MLDEHSGHGGSYLLDPETGVRTLIQRTLPPQPPQVETDGTAAQETPDLDRNGVDLRNRSDSNRIGRRTSKGSGNHTAKQ